MRPLTLVWTQIAVFHPAALDGLVDADPRRSHGTEPRIHPADGQLGIFIGTRYTNEYER